MNNIFHVHRIAAFILLGLTLIQSNSRASHILGGELSWSCQGNGSYIFDLVVYRDCNGFDVSVNNETIQVWNHMTVNEISMNFISRTDMSPFCQQVPMGPAPFNCGTGSAGGNGTGAVERVLYRSNPIILPGNPPPAGWIFTYSSFFRSSNLTNIASPNTVGITIVAKMFNTGANGLCNDSSPKFYEPPFVVTCASTPYTFNPSAFDPDLDSLSFEFAAPLDQILVSYNPPNDPAQIAFNPGFSFTSPTPDAAMSAGSTAANLNAQNGSLTFNSSLPGNFAIRTIVKAYRNGVVISENQLEYQVAVENCMFINSAPAVTPPFNNNTSFETTIVAGELVTFNLSVFENELLHNGTPQTAYIYASGVQFAQNITNAASGCDNPPCASLNNAIPASGSPTAQVNFSWQTSCSHLIGANGQTQNLVPYYFVFRVQDDFCQIPGVQYVTVTINVQNFAMPTAPELYCITITDDDEVELNWNPSEDVGANFVGYEIHSLQDGLIATINDINSTNYTHVGSNALSASSAYFVLAKGGCDGLFASSSDTLSTIFLDLVNPNTGFAQLSWNGVPNLPGIGDYVYIEMEYPAGTWTVVDSVPLGTNNLAHEITICEAYLDFRAFVSSDQCISYSNLQGDFFEDDNPPPIPIIQSVSIDTASNQLIITWDVNPASDTYGYIIYDQDNLGFYVELDTIWGRENTSYTIDNFDPNSVLSFTVAAFDSCFTDQIPPTYQTSGKANVHATMYLTSQVDVCAETLNLTWTPYEGWNDGVALYRIFVKPENSNWFMAQATNQTSAAIILDAGVVYDVVVQAVSEEGFHSFSNRIFANLELPGAPEIHYLSTASVEWDGVAIKYFSSFEPQQGTIILQKLNPIQQIFEDIEERVVTTQTELFLDENHSADKMRETYRILAIDSCGNPTFHTNIGKTILLSLEPNQAAHTIKLQWTPYEEFSAPIVAYRIYRGMNGVLDPEPLAILPHNTRTYLDSLTEYIHTSGQFCYFVQAVEGSNVFGFSEVSSSNYACTLLEPIIFIPNTIIINGVNELFLPVLGFYQVHTYELTIMNRWGQYVFRTNNSLEGWDGRNNGGDFVTEGTYIYILRINNGENTEVTRRGHVYVLIGE